MRFFDFALRFFIIENNAMYDESGARYYAPRFSTMGSGINVAVNYAQRGNVYGEMYAGAVASDPIIAELEFRYECIFSESDPAALMGS